MPNARTRGRDLTPEEEAQLAVYVEKWREIASRSGPSDRPETKEAIKKQYKEAGLEEPTYWVWAPDPKTANFCAYLIHYHWGELRRLEIVGDDQNAHECREALTLLREQIEPYGDDAVKIKPDAEAIVAEHADACGGNLAAGWLGACDFFREVYGLKEQTESIVGAVEAAKHCGMWWAFENAVVVSDRVEGGANYWRVGRDAPIEFMPTCRAMSVERIQQMIGEVN